MDPFKVAIVVMAITDHQWQGDSSRDEHRAMSSSELDALADFSWHWADVRASLTAGANAIRSRWPRASHRVEPAPLPAAEATSRACAGS